MNSLENIVSHFEINSQIEKITPLGNGLINDTYKVETKGDSPDYVLQRINNAIFKDVELLQSNIDAVTSHIRKKLEQNGEKDIDRKVLQFVKCKDNGKTYYFDSEKYWRLGVFIKNSKTYDTVNPEYSYYAGKAFGNFQYMLSDIGEKLGETIPDFHNMELRLNQLKEAEKADAAGRLKDKEVRDILDELYKFGSDMCLAERLHREGKLPKRICHCDTKVNNMLFDENGDILCVIDLDTVMPSFVFSDFGDFLRTAANTGEEDDKNPDNVNFNMEIFKAFSKGYLESASSFLTETERENLAYSALLFPYMQAVRFFADYINGDTYYKIKYPDHNLVRTKAQLKLFKSALSHFDEMKKYIAEL